MIAVSGYSKKKTNKARTQQFKNKDNSLCIV